MSKWIFFKFNYVPILKTKRKNKIPNQFRPNRAEPIFEHQSNQEIKTKADKINDTYMTKFMVQKEILG